MFYVTLFLAIEHKKLHITKPYSVYNQYTSPNRLFLQLLIPEPSIDTLEYLGRKLIQPEIAWGHRYWHRWNALVSTSNLIEKWRTYIILLSNLTTALLTRQGIANGQSKFSVKDQSSCTVPWQFGHQAWFKPYLCCFWHKYQTKTVLVYFSFSMSQRATITLKGTKIEETNHFSLMEQIQLNACMQWGAVNGCCLNEQSLIQSLMVLYAEIYDNNLSSLPFLFQPLKAARV